VPAGREKYRGWTVVQRISAVLAALAALQLVAVSTATRLESTDELMLPTMAATPLVVAQPARPVITPNTVPAVGRGWAMPVSTATAHYADQIRTRYHEIPNKPPPSDAAPLLEVIGLNKSRIADIVALPRPGAVISQHRGLTIRDDPMSRFRIQLDSLRRVVVVAVDGAPDVQFEIDYRDGMNDLHRIGVTPVLVSHRFEGTVPRSRGELVYPLVTPTYDAGSVTHTTISNEDGVLLVRFDGGPYANLSVREEAEGATYLEVRIEVTERRVLIDLAGLYYVRPAVGAQMLFADGGESTPLTVAADVPPFLLYLESPSRVDVTDPTFGDYRLRTDVTRLQVQWDGVGTAFELDFDHAFKDRGQTSVQSRLVFRTRVAG